MEGHSKDRYCPEKILQLGERNQLVAGCLLLWRKGELAWDEALAYALVLLAEHGDRLEQLVASLVDKKDDAVRLGAADSGAVRPGAGDTSVLRLGGEDSCVVQLEPDDVPPAARVQTTKGAKTIKGGESPRAGQNAKGREK
jgi:hypothetical protein